MVEGWRRERNTAARQAAVIRGFSPLQRQRCAHVRNVSAVVWEQITLPLVSRLVFECDAGSAKPRGPRDLQQVHERPH